MHGFSYEQLAFHLVDSQSFRTFVRHPMGWMSNKSTLQRNSARISESSWEEINPVLVLWAAQEKLETGARIGIDSTASETDSSSHRQQFTVRFDPGRQPTPGPAEGAHGRARVGRPDGIDDHFLRSYPTGPAARLSDCPRARPKAGAALSRPAEDGPEDLRLCPGRLASEPRPRGGPDGGAFEGAGTLQSTDGPCDRSDGAARAAGRGGPGGGQGGVDL
ncbi:MAG: hypothetical protein ACRD1R_06385 [Acidobacteriota bacterium]